MNKIEHLQNEIKEREWTALLAGGIILGLTVALIAVSVRFYLEKSMNWEGKYKSALNFIRQDLPTESEDEIIKTIQDIIEVNARGKWIKRKE